MTTICHLSVNRFNKKHHVCFLVFLTLYYVVWSHCVTACTYTQSLQTVFKLLHFLHILLCWRYNF